MGARQAQETPRAGALIVFCTQISDRQVFLGGARAKDATVALHAFRSLQPEDRSGQTWMTETLALSYLFEWEQDGMTCRWTFEERHKGDEKGKVTLRSSLWAMLEEAKIPLRITDRTGALGG